MYRHISSKLSEHANLDLIRNQKIIDSSLVNFAGNDYLCIADDPEVISALQEGASIYGLGSKSSALVSGYTNAHYRLEKEFADYIGREDAILFNSGYHANLGIIWVLSNIIPDIYIAADKLCHASIIDGIMLSKAKFRRYIHNQYESAQNIINSSNSDNNIIITESIFSMEGDIFDYKNIGSISNTYFMVDDAHGIGILGKDGLGIVELFDKIDVLVTPMGKAFGSMGALVSGKAELIEALRQFARPYIYSTAICPAVAHASITCLSIMKKQDHRREKLIENINHLIQKSRILGINLVSEDVTPIKSIIIGDIEKTLKIQQKLLDNGFYISCIRPPTVPNNTTRIRISLNSGHSTKDIDKMLELISQEIMS